MRAIPLKKLVKLYLQSSEFNRLRDQTKLDYTRFLKILTDTLGETTASVVSGKDARMAYEEWVTRGIHLANHVAAVAGIVYRHGQDMEYVKNNPFTLVRELSPVARNTVWTQDQVRQFLDEAVPLPLVTRTSRAPGLDRGTLLGCIPTHRRPDPPRP